MLTIQRMMDQQTREIEEIKSQLARYPTKIIKYKDVSSESGVGVRENLSLVWLVFTNHGAYIFI
jgi:hypothetical protein